MVCAKRICNKQDVHSSKPRMALLASPYFTFRCSVDKIILAPLVLKISYANGRRCYPSFKVEVFAHHKYFVKFFLDLLSFILILLLISNSQINCA